ncbi:MAG: hypothetical protein MJ025_05740 [Victivallaceae bacterium]|nr:hypothetical protein [Victivallaceae bacterium]
MKRNRLNLIEMMAALIIFCIIFVAGVRMIDMFRHGMASSDADTDIQAAELMNIFSMVLADTSYSADYTIGSSFFVIEKRDSGDAVAALSGANFSWMKTISQKFKFVELATEDIEVDANKRRFLVLRYFSDDPSTQCETMEFREYLPPYPGHEITDTTALIDKIHRPLFEKELDDHLADDKPYCVRLADNVTGFQVIPFRYVNNGKEREPIELEKNSPWYGGVPDTIEIRFRLMPRPKYEKYIKMADGDDKTRFETINSSEYVGTFKPWVNE